MINPNVPPIPPPKGLVATQSSAIDSILHPRTAQSSSTTMMTQLPPILPPKQPPPLLYHHNVGGGGNNLNFNTTYAATNSRNYHHPCYRRQRQQYQPPQPPPPPPPLYPPLHFSNSSFNNNTAATTTTTDINDDGGYNNLIQEYYTLPDLTKSVLIDFERYNESGGFWDFTSVVFTTTTASTDVTSRKNDHNNNFYKQQHHKISNIECFRVYETPERIPNLYEHAQSKEFLKLIYRKRYIVFTSKEKYDTLKKYLDWKYFYGKIFIVDIDQFTISKERHQLRRQEFHTTAVGGGGGVGDVGEVGGGRCKYHHSTSCVGAVLSNVFNYFSIEDFRLRTYSLNFKTAIYDSQDVFYNGTATPKEICIYHVEDKRYDTFIVRLSMNPFMNIIETSDDTKRNEFLYNHYHGFRTDDGNRFNIKQEILSKINEYDLVFVKNTKKAQEFLNFYERYDIIKPRIEILERVFKDAPSMNRMDILSSSSPIRGGGANDSSSNDDGDRFMKCAFLHKHPHSICSFKHVQFLVKWLTHTNRIRSFVKIKQRFDNNCSSSPSSPNDDSGGVFFDIVVNGGGGTNHYHHN